MGSTALLKNSGGKSARRRKKCPACCVLIGRRQSTQKLALDRIISEIARKKNNANNIRKENTISTLERNLSEGMLTLAHMDDKQSTTTGSNPNLNFATESYLDLSLPASTHFSRPLTPQE
ncbi:hypothetical protein TNCV_4164621 [Trichonephila clavipes]|nr:hypothetical protein TNCV_4164621 [Trichonephila clavipes]